MKDSGIAWINKIPTDWKVVQIKQNFKERNEQVSDIDYEALSVTKNGIVKQLEGAAKTDNHDNRKKVCKLDFVINSRSDRKQSCGMSEFEGSVSVISIVLEIKSLKPHFVKYLLKNYGFAEEFYRWGTGIVADLWSTKYERMKRIMIPVPSSIDQQKIAEYLDQKCIEIDNFITQKQQLLTELETYKKSLIYECVTGKREVV